VQEVKVRQLWCKFHAADSHGERFKDGFHLLNCTQAEAERGISGLEQLYP